MEDTVNALIAQGVSRAAILGSLLRILRYFLGSPGGVLIDEDGMGELTGIVLGNPQLIETVATLAEAENWELTTFSQAASDDGEMNGVDANITYN